jgi:hypothetical protein
MRQLSKNEQTENGFISGFGDCPVQKINLAWVALEPTTKA